MMASVVVTCKGRLEQLKRTLPEHFKHAPAFEWELIVVDYGCPDGTFDWVREQNHPNTRAVRVLDRVEFFNLSRARNVGACAAAGRYLCFCDADVYPRGPWLQTLVETLCADESLSMLRPKWKRGGCGICGISQATYMAIRGHDEALEGWGWEDIDLKGRAEKVGKVGFYDASMLGILKHGRAASVQFYEEKRVKGGLPITNQLNKKKSQTRRGLPNPAGFGQGVLELWKPTA